MPKAGTYIIVKHREPTDKEKNRFKDLHHPEEIDLFPTTDDVIIKRRKLLAHEVRRVKSRKHVAHVYKPKVMKALGIVHTESILPGPSATADEVRTYHKVDEVWQAGFKGKGIKVFILDTGITHGGAALLTTNRLKFATSMVSGESFIDTNDNASHGTWVTGLVADTAPECEVGVCKVLSSRDGNGMDDGIIQGIAWAINNGANIISQSLGGSNSPALDAAVNAARRVHNVLMPCAAGNEQKGRSDFTADIESPGKADGAISTGCIDIEGNIAFFSSEGNSVDIAAVGYNVDNSRWQPSPMSGTSMSCPVISATCACLLSKNNDPESVENAIFKGARATSMPRVEDGSGILDGAGALNNL